MIKQRLYRFDNIKFILIFLVVFGHMLEFTPGYTNTHDIYRIIYSFHMPVFIFVSGYFARFSPRKILTTYIWPYILLQTLYLAMVYYYLDPSLEKTFQYSQAFWIMWYLPCMIGMHMAIPLFDTKNKGLRLLYLCIAVGVSLHCGFDSAISIPFSASKILVFMPFFMLGYYAKTGISLKELKKGWRILIFAVSAVLVLLCIVYIAKRDIISYEMMLGQYNYQRSGLGATYRAILLGIALIWTTFFVSAPFLDKKIPIISSIGQYTFPIFVFHGFVLKFIAKNSLAFKFGGMPIVNSLLITIAVVLLLGNPWAQSFFKYCFTLEPLVSFVEKKKKKAETKEEK